MKYPELDFFWQARFHLTSRVYIEFTGYSDARYFSHTDARAGTVSNRARNELSRSRRTRTAHYQATRVKPAVDAAIGIFACSLLVKQEYFPGASASKLEQPEFLSRNHLLLTVYC